MSVSYVDRQTLAAISPTVCQALSLSDTEYGWLTSAFSIAYLAFAPLAGGIIDRIGCRKGLVWAVLAWSCVSAAHALAPSFAVLFALRILLGTAEAPSFPGGAQAVRRALPASQRSAGFGLLFTGSSIGGMVAGPLAVNLLKHTSWRAAFVGTALVGLAWVPIWFVVSGAREARSALDSRTEAARGATATGRQEWLRLLFDPAVFRGLVLVVASAPAIGFVLNWLPKYLVAERSLVQAELARYIWAPPLFFDLGAVGFGALASLRERTSTHASHRGLVTLATILAVAIGLLPFAPGAWAAVGAACVALMGGGGLYALLTADMLSRVDRTRTSLAGGMAAAAQSLAYVVANPLIGTIIQRTHSYRDVLVTLAVAIVPGAIAWIAWPVATPRAT
jgi:MFS transporter, ACS family, hexuronate transporter